MKVQTTSRSIRNVATGIDASVPSFEKVANPRDVHHYHILVVTNKTNVKSGEHTADQVVQFMAARTFEDFEKFHAETSQQYPQFALPPLPRKMVLFMSMDTVIERQKAFSAIVEFASKTAKLSKSLPFYHLLGVDPLGDRMYVKKRQDWLELQKEQKKKDPFAEEDDLFGADPLEEQDTQSRGAAQTSTLFEDSSLFEDDLDGPTSKASGTKAFQFQLDDPLLGLVTKGDLMAETLASEEAGEVQPSKEDQELLEVEDSLDDLLKITAPTKGTGLVGSKASSRQMSEGKSLFDEEKVKSKVQSMNTDDILSYITANTATDDDDVDLF